MIFSTCEMAQTKNKTIDEKYYREDSSYREQRA